MNFNNAFAENFNFTFYCPCCRTIYRPDELRAYTDFIYITCPRGHNINLFLYLKNHYDNPKIVVSLFKMYAWMGLLKLTAAFTYDVPGFEYDGEHQLIINMDTITCRNGYKHSPIPEAELYQHYEEHIEFITAALAADGNSAFSQLLWLENNGKKDNFVTIIKNTVRGRENDFRYKMSWDVFDTQAIGDAFVHAICCDYLDSIRYFKGNK